jgi:hypothetical protein
LNEEDVMSRALRVLAAATLVLFSLAPFALCSTPTVDWIKVYGDTAASELAYWIVEHSYHGYAVAAYTERPTGASIDGTLLRLNEAGDTLWTQTYGDTLDDAVTCVYETDDGGYILAGYTESTPANADAWLVRTDSMGDTLWTSQFDFGGAEYLHCVLETPDGGFIATGFTTSYDTTGALDVLVLRTDEFGDSEWKAHFDINGGDDRGLEICSTPDGHYAIAGFAEDGADLGDILIIKIDDTNRDLLWTKVYPDSGRQIASAIQATYDGGLIVGGGRIGEIDWPGKAFLMKTDADGDSIWMREYGGPDNDSYFSSVAETADLGYICGGRHYADSTGVMDFYFVKTDVDGDTLWTKLVGDDGHQSAGCVVNTRDGGYAAAGYTRDLVTYDRDIYLVKLGVDQAGVVHAEGLGASIQLEISGQNPFADQVPIRFEIPYSAHVDIYAYDVMGRRVANIAGGIRSAGVHHLGWDCRNTSGRRVASGMYFIRCDALGMSATESALILR